MFTRLLALLYLLSLAQPSQAQQLKTLQAPDTCRVTTPAEQPFVPPAPYRAKPSEGSFWFGTDRLWTSLPSSGSWSGLPPYTPDDTTFRQKMIFGRQGYDPMAEPQPKLRLTGKRLDGLAPLLLSDEASNGWTRRDQPFMVTGINFPTIGCWKITAHYKTEDLTFVLWIAK